MSDYNKQRDIIAGLRILQGAFCTANNEEFAAEAGHELDDAQRARLNEFGWFFDPANEEGARWWVIYV